MRSSRHFLAIGATMFAAVLLACASEGDLGTAAASESDASSDPRDAGIDPTDARPDTAASSCSASNLCTVAIPVDSSMRFTDMWGSSDTDVWAVGTSGTILHYGGATWERANPTTLDGSTVYTLTSVWTERPDEVWITDGTILRHGTGWRGPSATEWSFVPSPPGDPRGTIIRGRANSVWLGRNVSFSSSVARFDGWVDGGPGPQDVLQLDYPPTDIALTGPNEAWIVASDMTTGHVYRASRPEGEQTWQIEEYDAKTKRALRGAWGDESVLWVAGSTGTLRRITRSDVPSKTFEVVPSSLRVDLNDVFGFGPDDVWVVGDESTVLHWDGTSWTKLSTPFDEDGGLTEKPDLHAVWGSSTNDVWIAGDGAMLHFRGTSP